MSTQNQYQCKCAACQSAQPNPTKAAHKLMNHFLATLDDGRRRFYVGLEAVKRGHGSEKGLALIIGWTEAAIHEARKEVEAFGATPAPSAHLANQPPPGARVIASAGRSSEELWDCSPLPPGLSINANTGYLSGRIVSTSKQDGDEGGTQK